MRRVLKSLPPLAAVMAAVSLLGGCGVAADDTAATVGDETVTTTSVDDLARDASFVASVLQGQPADTESVLPGDLARQTLQFQVQAAAAEAELARLGGEVGDEDLEAGRQTVEQNVTGSPSDETVRVLSRYVAVNQALAARLGELDPGSESDRRLIYEGAPALWDRTCVVLLAVPGELVAEVGDDLDAGASLRDVAEDRPNDAQIVADPEEACITSAQLPDELREGVDATPAGSGGPVVLTTPGGDQAFFWRVEGTEQVSFEDAGDDLERIIGALAEQPEQAIGQWIGVTLLDAVEVNPRYGRPSTSLNGSFEILPPAAPLSVTPGVVVPSAADPTAAGASGTP